MWTAEKLNEGIPERGSVSYSAAIESAAATDKELSLFAQRVDREACRRGFHDAQRRVILGDGALWIWNIASELFPDAIVDLFHAKQHLWEKAREIYGDGELTEAWARKQCSILEEGHVDRVIAALRKHDAAGYLERNRARVRKVPGTGSVRLLRRRRGQLQKSDRQPDETGAVDRSWCGRGAQVLHAQWAL